MQTTEFTASAGKTLPPFFLMTALTAGFVMAAAAAWANFLVAGILLVPAGLCLLGAVILGYRILLRPVMLRVGPDGLFMKRLSVTIPWEALSRIERTSWKGNPIYALIPAEPRHPALEERTVLLGAAMNHRLGLPDHVVQMEQYSGSPVDFEDAVRAVDGPVIVDAT